MFHPSRGIGKYLEKINENAVIIPLFRNNDPVTSKKAGQSVARRAPSQQVILLRAYRGGRGLTDEEAGIATGLAQKPRCCYWKRCSELRAKGYIIPTGETARSTAGEMQRICKMTLEGERYLRSLEA